MDETHLLIKTDLLEEVKAEFQAQVRFVVPFPSFPLGFPAVLAHAYFPYPVRVLPLPLLHIASLRLAPPQLEEFTFKAQIEAESGNAKPKQR